MISLVRQSASSSEHLRPSQPFPERLSEDVFCLVKWRGAFSDSFGISHGVNQGGLGSPTCFAILYDTLLQELANSGYGCSINGTYYGVVAYADDIVIMAPSYQALKSMLVKCEAWSKRNDISFNGAKSQFIVFRKKNDPTFIRDLPTLCGTDIPMLDDVIHLGHKINCFIDDSAEVTAIARQFNRQFHATYFRFSKLQDPAALVKLTQSYCTSFYGVEIVDLDQVSYFSRKLLRKSVNVAYMEALSLPKESISKFLIAEGLLNAESMYKYRCLTYFSRIMKDTTHWPHRSVVLSHGRDKITKLCKSVGLIPATLRFLGSNILHKCIVQEWGTRKNILPS